MAETVGQHGLAAFVNPSNGDALDASVVKGNDNTIRSAYVSHDDDGGIHVQSSTLAARPAAGTVGRKWVTTDTGSLIFWYDNGSAWESLAVDLTNLNASNLTSGTVPSGRFPATLPATVTASSLTSVGTLSALTVSGSTTLGATAMANATLSQPIIKDYGETKTAPTISAGTLTLNLANGNVFVVPLTANITTLTISNPKSSGTACSFTLVLTADGTARTVTWGASVKWPNASAPVLTSTNTKNDTFVFVTWDGGTTWYAFTSGQNS